MTKIGRNDPCPCGSGNKIKRCCGAATQTNTVGRERARRFMTHVFPTLSKADIALENNRLVERTQREFNAFKECVEAGQCPSCSGMLDTLDEARPCLHWLLDGKRLKKRLAAQALDVAKQVGFIRFDAFLRWMANSSVPIQNINDLPNPEKEMIIEQTIILGETELSFACAPTDFTGHAGTASDYPHYHVQMRVGQQTVIKYNDYHLPFTEDDLFRIELFRNYPDKVNKKHLWGAGMSELFDLSPERLIESSRERSASGRDVLRMQTVITSDAGETFSGDRIIAALAESNKTGHSMAAILGRDPSGLNVRTMVCEGPSVPEVAERQGGRKSKK